jgi:RNA polymerase sigma-70 factor (ECF subfamily)
MRTAAAAAPEAGMQSDEQLLTRFLEGDELAFEELVARYETGLRNVAFGFVRDHGLAEDIAQDTFIRAYRKASTIRRGGSVKGWLYRVAINRAQDELRRIKRKREVSVDDLDTDPEAAKQTSGESLAASKELRRHLSRALSEMREEHRLPLVLREVEGMTYAEIAEQLGWPLGTVQTRVHRGRLELRTLLRGIRGIEGVRP